MMIEPGWIGDLIDQIDKTPEEFREQVVQAAVQAAGEAKGLRWIPYLQELHTIYLTRVKGPKRKKERWAWLQTVLENESTDGLSGALQILIEAMGKQQGRTWQETCEAIETPIDALVLEVHVRKTIIMGVIMNTAMPQLIAILSCVQDNIEKARGLEPGTLIHEITRASKNENDGFEAL